METKAPSSRLLSLDILRGLIILVMMFVNDLAGVGDAPAWMKHIEPSDSDGMTFVDLVFPAFLFIVGMSIPFALGGRLEKGTPARTIWRHICLRSFSLLIIGFFMVNGETIAKHAPLRPDIWGLLTHIGFVLIWIAFPATWKQAQRITPILRIVGVFMLIAGVFLYRGNDATGWFQMRQQWWGILGLIGWAYLVASSIYMFLRKNLAGVIGMIPLLYCLAIAEAAGGLGWFAWLAKWVSIGTTLGSQAAITVAGMALGMILVPGSPIVEPVARIRWAFFFGLGLGIAGILVHSGHHFNPVFIYNKNAATIPWCLVSSAVTAWLWIITYILGDLRPQKCAALLVRPGQNALLAYIFAPLFYFLLDFLISLGAPSWYYAIGNHFVIGFWRSLIFAVAILAAAGWFQKKGVYLKL